MSHAGVRLVLTFCTVFAAACSTSESPTAPTQPISSQALAYVEEMVSIMQANALHRAMIDWTDFRNRVVAAASSAQSVQDVQRGALGTALELLRDKHSLFLSPTGQVIAAAAASCAASRFTSPPPRPDVGYVRVGAFSGSAAEAAQFAARIHAAIVESDRDDLAGWMIDLRSNSGGNMWPMLAGLAPVLGDGVLGYFVNPTGETLRWDLRDGVVRLNGMERMRAPSTHRLRRDSPLVAVLTDGLTASSGEAVAIAFRHRPRTRSFGTPTCGASTANTGFPMSDGSTLVLTVAVMADRTGAPYGGSIPPDEIAEDPQAVVERAVAWLAGAHSQ